jgi:hypothetical protein
VIVNLMRRESPDGKNVACCLCFEWFSLDELAIDPADGLKWDMCQGCWDYDQAPINRRVERCCRK